MKPRIVAPRKPRPPLYGLEVIGALRFCWAVLGAPTGKRLAPVLGELVPTLRRFGELELSEEVVVALMGMSAATIDRRLAADRAKLEVRGHSHTKPGSLLKEAIPIRTWAQWDDAVPGFVEIDLVGHEGGNAIGDHAYTLTVTDIATGWTENRSVQNKAQKCCSQHFWRSERCSRSRSSVSIPTTAPRDEQGMTMVPPVLVMTGLGGLNPSKDALVLGLVQQQVPQVNEPSHLKTAAERIAKMVRGAKTGMPTLDLLVFPEYSLNGLNPKSWARDAMLCDLDGPEVETLRGACASSSVWGCFSLMERNPQGAPYNSGIIVDDTGEIVLYYRKMHPMVPLEPWEPGDLGIPVCDGPAGAKLALIICHDGMLPEMAREAAYKGANVILRTAGYTDPVRHAWQITNQVNAFTNVAYTASVALTELTQPGSGPSAKR